MTDKPENAEPALLQPLSAHLSYAALIDEHGCEIEITEQMIDQACREAEICQQFPFAVAGHILAPVR